jgi:DNA polymerase delta subunit 1
MMAHNLCYSTLISRSQAMEMDDDQYTHTPHGDYFVKTATKKGILPMILEELIGARK